MPLMTSEHMPQIPSRQSESNAIGSCPRPIKPSLTTSSISRNDMSASTSLASYVSKCPVELAFCCRQTLRVRFMSLVAARAHVEFLVHQRLRVHFGWLVGAAV